MPRAPIGLNAGLCDQPAGHKPALTIGWCDDTAGRRTAKTNGSTALRPATPRAMRPCRRCSAAKAPTSPRWPISACRCRQASRSRPKFARCFSRTARQLPARLRARRRGRLGKQSARRSARAFGDERRPLLVSVRSGSRASMPGMMDTILNLGLNDKTVEALADLTGDAPLRLRQLPPLYPDVRRRRAWR